MMVLWMLGSRSDCRWLSMLDGLGAFPLQVAVLRFKLRVLRRLVLPAYKGSALRGAFGHFLRRHCCDDRRRACAECARRPDCSYALIFESVRPRNEAAPERWWNAKVPHPFVIEPPAEWRTHYREQDALEFRFLLFGPAVRAYPAVILAYYDIGRTLGLGLAKEDGAGKYFIESVTDEATGSVLFDGMTGLMRRLEPGRRLGAHVAARRAELGGGRGLTMRLRTPLTLKEGNRLLAPAALTLPSLVRHLYRRVGAIGWYYAGWDWGRPERELTDAAATPWSSSRLRHYAWRRRSGRQDAWIEMDGWLGAFAGDRPADAVLDLLCAGELLHLGKWTAFGHGAYRLAAA